MVRITRGWSMLSISAPSAATIAEISHAQYIRRLSKPSADDPA
jgi:hypothetical protein